ncbi:MAG: hypothetical protein KF802_07415 [Bdellovibrionaceae bacterium]|nr:hypothetical protein [Pseudobdellovibrionaceae bacterium]MBX3033000.1 hypothetical protein [Pseudobdellovibrionaceae bacterium]
MKTPSKVFFHQQAPWSPSWGEDCLLIFDRRLSRHPSFARWSRRFPAAYAVTAGESLKDIGVFPKHVKAISRLAGPMASRRLTIVVAGGGSVGDFGGFVASVFKRGVRLVQVPTTWLAAIDSAHGGKNGLNVGGAKNQIGTIYPAAEIHVVRAFLETQGPERAREAAGEILKINLLKKIPSAKGDLWRSLPRVIAGKMSIVRRDPLEKSGVRHLLNFGHTMGHVFEAALSLPHGSAVGYGLVFAVAYSRAKGLCAAKDYEKIIADPLWSLFIPSRDYLDCLGLPPARVKGLLLKDKKRTAGDKLRFIFLKKPGQPVIREVGVDEILRELKRQKDLLRSVYG